tara:strand:- start:2702 stop:2809 length:108 start_codon:yes stop_codon:yes gene_type:complete
MAKDKKSPKEASELFGKIIKASVKGDKDKPKDKKK